MMCPRRPERFQELKSSAHPQPSTTQMLRCTWKPCRRRCVSMDLDVCLHAGLCLITSFNPCLLSTAPITAFIISLSSHSLSSHSFAMLGFFVQSGIDIGKLLMAKKKQDAKQKRKQEKAKKKAKKEAKSQVWFSM